MKPLKENYLEKYKSSKLSLGRISIQDSGMNKQVDVFVIPFTGQKEVTLNGVTIIVSDEDTLVDAALDQIDLLDTREEINDFVSEYKTSPDEAVV